MAEQEECPMCDDPIGGRAAIMSQLIDWVDLKNDIFIVGVGGTDTHPCFSYTIGMEKNFESPELVVYGLPQESAHHILNAVKDMIKGGWKLLYDTKIPKIAHDFDTIFKDFPRDKVEQIFNLTAWYYRDREFRTAQIVWPDENNVFPWEEGFDAEYKDYQRNV